MTPDTRVLLDVVLLGFERGDQFVDLRSLGADITKDLHFGNFLIAWEAGLIFDLFLGEDFARSEVGIRVGKGV